MSQNVSSSNDCGEASVQAVVQNVLSGLNRAKSASISRTRALKLKGNESGSAVVHPPNYAERVCTLASQHFLVNTWLSSAEYSSVRRIVLRSAPRPAV